MSAISASEGRGALAYAPPALFTIVMGTGGLGLAWSRAGRIPGMPAGIGDVLLLLAAGLFVVIAGAYIAKAIRHPAMVAADLRHPVTVNFLPAAAIGLMILGSGLSGYGSWAGMLWIAGALAQLLAALWIIGRWITQEQPVAAANPAWFIPVVGTILAPVGGVAFGHLALSWFMFAVGLFFWLTLMPVLMNRILFHARMPPKLWPTLAILVAPPAVGYLSWQALTGGGDDVVSRILFAAALFLALILISRARHLAAAPFSMAWWAYTFPGAALALACLRQAELGLMPGGTAAAGAVLLMATGLLILVGLRTIIGLIRGSLLVPD